MPEGENNNDSQVKVAQPGAVISPGSEPERPQEATLSIQHDSPERAPEQPSQAQVEQAAVPQPIEPSQPAPQMSSESLSSQAQSAPPDTESVFFHTESENQPSASENASQSVSWTASEFIAHAKSTGWYLGLIVAAAILAFFIYILTKDFVSVAVVIVAALIFGVYGSHKPRQLEYRLDNQGLTVGGRHYGYDQFKSFSVVPEGGVTSIVFMPLKRFATTVTVYCPPEDEDKIMAVLTGSLPYEEPRRDTVDSLMKKIRF